MVSVSRSARRRTAVLFQAARGPPDRLLGEVFRLTAGSRWGSVLSGWRVWTGLTFHDGKRYRHLRALLTIGKTLQGTWQTLILWGWLGQLSARLPEVSQCSRNVRDLCLQSLGPAPRFCELAGCIIPLSSPNGVDGIAPRPSIRGWRGVCHRAAGARSSRGRAAERLSGRRAGAG